ncbi:MAG: HAD-IIIA family hydrolase, partial [Proteobacteria bacterium]|nr:HAD-IIIA family hydrolase [Pseudomonadota bacterium]
HYLAEQVQDYIEQLNTDLQLIEFYEPKLLGSAGTIAANPDFADGTDEVIIIYADNFSNVNLAKLLAFHRQHNDPITMLLFHAPNPKACGIAELDDENRIINFVEKPEQPKTNFANAGIYVIDAQAYRGIAAMQAFDLGFDVLPKFVGRMRGWVWDGYHSDVGTYKTYLKAQRDAVELDIDKFNQGRPAIFLDRDGTLIESVHYLSQPEQVQLVPGGGEAIKQLREAGFACILITNQSPIGQGIITEEDLTAIHAVLSEQLAEYGTKLDGFYHCPAVSQVKDRTIVDSYDRK